MKMTLILAALLVSGSLSMFTTKQANDDEPQNPGEVTVTIIGQLKVTGRILVEWDECLQKDRTGAHVLAPAETDLMSYWGNLPPREAAGFRWELYIGKDQAMQDRARELADKRIKVTGKLHVVGHPPHPVLGRWKPRLFVQVETLKAL